MEWWLNNTAPRGKFINNRRYVLIIETENEIRCGDIIHRKGTHWQHATEKSKTTNLLVMSKYLYQQVLTSLVYINKP